jgi:hypothetical protein
MSSSRPGAILRILEDSLGVWDAATEAITRWRLWNIFARFSPDDEFDGVPADQMRAAQDSLDFDTDLANRSADERTAVLIAGALTAALCLGAAVAAIAAVRSFVAWTRDAWAATKPGESDQHFTRFVEQLPDSLHWPGPWPLLLTIATLSGLIYVSWRMYNGSLAILDDRLNTLARPRLREFVNLNSNLGEDPVLHVTRAPSLTQVSTTDHLVDRPEAHRIRRLITELGASAVAVSGSRGSGKTTLLRNIAYDPERSPKTADSWLEVHTSAPVGYDSREFLVHLHIRLCEIVRKRLHSGRGTSSRVLSAARQVLWFSVKTALALILLLVVQESFVYPMLTPDLQTDRLISALHEFTTRYVTRMFHGWPLGGLIGVALIGFLMAYVAGRRPEPSGGARPIWTPSLAELDRLTHRNLARLRFVQTTNSTWSGSFTAWRLSTGWGRSRQLAEVPLSLPELVDNYRNHVSEVARAWRTGTGALFLAVTIDEMDRISDPAQAERFLNDIKAIFNIPGCVYLVSVSEDALSGFESRIVHVRTAMDSSFDAVVRLPPFTLDQSLDLLRRRVVGFPDLFTALCHGVSGGVPRDLVRAARTLIELRHDTQESRLAPLARGLVDAEIAALRRGLTAQLAHHEDPAASAAVLPHLIGEREQLSSRDIFAEVATIAKVKTAENAELVEQLAAGLQYYAIVLEIFEGALDFASTAVSDAASPQRLLLDQLARTRASLQVGPAVAAAQLEQLRGTIRSASARVEPVFGGALEHEG